MPVADFDDIDYGLDGEEEPSDDDDEDISQILEQDADVAEIEEAAEVAGGVEVTDDSASEKDDVSDDEEQGAHDKQVTFMREDVIVEDVLEDDKDDDEAEDMPQASFLTFARTRHSLTKNVLISFIVSQPYCSMCPRGVG